MDKIQMKIDFLAELDKFKRTFRRGYVWGIQRRENDAEHERHMCMFAILLKDELWYTDVDLLLTLKIILVHDLVEIYAKDVFAFDEKGKK